MRTLLTILLIAFGLLPVASIGQPRNKKDTQPNPQTHELTDSRTLLAFPGAEGAGSMTTGGRGGRVIKVTNLNTTGPGSLQWACDQEGPRIVVFEVSGVIQAPRKGGKHFGSLSITKPDITIAGQTAPGAGITVVGEVQISRKGMDMNAEKANTILRFLRFRPSLGGGGRDANLRAVMVVNCRQVIVDHVSGSWQSDDGFSAWHAPDVTFQWCANEESDVCLETYEPHNFGMLVKAYGGGFTAHHNLITNHVGRAPACGADFTEFRNNVLYNNGGGGISPRTDKKNAINIVGNYSKPGPGGLTGIRIYYPPIVYARSGFGPGATGNYGLEGNFYEGRGGFITPWKGSKARGERTFSDKPIETGISPVTTHAADEAYKLVLAHAGCLPRDAVSKRSIAQVRTRTGEWGAHHPGGGLMEGLTPGKPPADSDNDGMPDAWEEKHDLNPKNPSDGNKTVPAGASPENRHKGYTWIEYYVNELADLKVAEALTRSRLDQSPARPWDKPALGLPPGGSPHKSIDSMIEVLARQKSNNWSTSSPAWYAIQQLSRMGEAAKAAVPRLIPMLKDKDLSRRSHAAWAIGAIGPAARDAVPALVEVLYTDEKLEFGKRDFVLFGFTAWALGRIGPDAAAAAEPLGKLLAGRGAWRRKQYRATEQAAWALTRLGVHARPAMGGLARTTANGSIYAAEALANIGADAVGHLTGILGGKGTGAAAHGLSLLGPKAKSAIPKLLDIVTTGQPTAKRAAALALVRIDPAATGVAQTLAKVLADDDFNARHGIAQALQEIGPAGKVAIPALEKALADEKKEIRRAAALALGGIGKAGIPALQKAVTHADRLVRKYAARALGNMGKNAGNAGVQALIKALSDNDADVRREAAWSLALIGPSAKNARSNLKKAEKKDTDYVVRYAAAAALEKIK